MYMIQVRNSLLVLYGQLITGYRPTLGAEPKNSETIKTLKPTLSLGFLAIYIHGAHVANGHMDGEPTFPIIQHYGHMGMVIWITPNAISHAITTIPVIYSEIKKMELWVYGRNERSKSRSVVNGRAESRGGEAPMNIQRIEAQ